MAGRIALALVALGAAAVVAGALVPDPWEGTGRDTLAGALVGFGLFGIVSGGLLAWRARPSRARRAARRLLAGVGAAFALLLALAIFGDWQ